MNKLTSQRILSHWHLQFHMFKAKCNLSFNNPPPPRKYPDTLHRLCFLESTWNKILKIPWSLPSPSPPMSNYSLVLLVSPLNVCQIISHMPYPLSQLKFKFYSFLTWAIPPRQGILHTGHLSGLPKISPLLLEIQQRTLVPLGLQ